MKTLWFLMQQYTHPHKILMNKCPKCNNGVIAGTTHYSCDLQNVFVSRANSNFAHFQLYLVAAGLNQCWNRPRLLRSGMGCENVVTKFAVCDIVQTMHFALLVLTINPITTILCKSVYRNIEDDTYYLLELDSYNPGPSNWCAS